MRQYQLEANKALEDGRDILDSGTGSGKILCQIIPNLMHPNTTSINQLYSLFTVTYILGRKLLVACASHLTRIEDMNFDENCLFRFFLRLMPAFFFF